MNTKKVIRKLKLNFNGQPLRVRIGEPEPGKLPDRKIVADDPRAWWLKLKQWLCWRILGHQRVTYIGSTRVKE